VRACVRTCVRAWQRRSSEYLHWLLFIRPLLRPCRDAPYRNHFIGSASVITPHSLYPRGSEKPPSRMFLPRITCSRRPTFANSPRTLIRERSRGPPTSSGISCPAAVLDSFAGSMVTFYECRMTFHLHFGCLASTRCCTIETPPRPRPPHNNKRTTTSPLRDRPLSLISGSAGLGLSTTCPNDGYDLHSPSRLYCFIPAAPT
jgi:hypothetical protein